MIKVIIPWPDKYSADFKEMEELFEEVGIVPAAFVLRFIFDHGGLRWASKFSEVDRWVSDYLKEHSRDLSIRLASGGYNSKEEYHELTCYSDKFKELVFNSVFDLEGVIGNISIVLIKFFSDIMLPRCEKFTGVNVVGYSVDRGYIAIELSPSIGDKINEFYNGYAKPINSNTTFT